MSRSPELTVSQQGWIHELARGESSGSSGGGAGAAQSQRTSSLQQKIEESGIQFLAELRDHFSEFIQVFNSYSEGGSRFQEVKLYSINQLTSDFLLFRNQTKLIFSNPTSGLVQIAWGQHGRGLEASFSGAAVAGPNQFSASVAPTAAGAASGVFSSASFSSSSVSLAAGAPSEVSGPQDILAQVGPFRDVYWTYQGEKVSPLQVAEFYFSEFVLATRDVRRSSTGNQLLLDQIKALLQQKGLNL
jgi:hypothetical protein